MRLLAHLEEFSKREKHTEQGIEGETFKLTKESPVPETKFEKVVKVDIGEFGYEGLVNDVLARAIIEHVNKAFRAYGYKTDLLPISHESDYEFVKDYSRGRQSVSDYNYKLSTSAFNKTADNPYDIKLLLNIIGTKALFLNYLINNGDMHWNNFVKQKRTKQHYAIDFGLAFTGEGRSDANHAELHNLKDDKKQVIDSEHKLERYAKYINFWNMYLQHNETYLLDLFKNKEKEILDKARRKADSLASYNVIASDVEKYVKKAKGTFIKRLNELKRFLKSTEDELGKQK